MAIIALNGYSGSGKDLVGKMIQYYTSPCSNPQGKYRTFEDFLKAGGGSDLRSFDHHYYTEWEIKKFAGKLKQIASMLTGIPVHKFEDQEFKKTTMSPEWDHIIETMTCGCNVVMGWYSQDGKCKNCGETTTITRHPKTVRTFLQQLGTDGLRDGLHTNVWVNALFADYVAEPDKNIAAFLAAEGLPQSMNGGQKEYPNWIITDCRFPNEAEAVKRHGGQIIRVNRPGITAINAHPSETSLDGWKFDVVIENDGTVQDLLAKVKTVLQEPHILV